jgi:hypothetical protein
VTKANDENYEDLKDNYANIETVIAAESAYYKVNNTSEYVNQLDLCD